MNKNYKQNKKVGLFLDIIAILFLLIPFVVFKYSDSVKFTMAFIITVCWVIAILLLIYSLVFYTKSESVASAISIIYRTFFIVGGIFFLIVVFMYVLSSLLFDLIG